MHELTVVLISKNQEWNVARLIESILTHTESPASRDIILVDSASTDRTVEIASQYPIRILQLSAEQFLSPAAGRYIGYEHTLGKYVLFMDGDNELYPGWLEIALAILEEHDDVAGITGTRILLREDDNEEDKPPLVKVHSEEFKTTDFPGGCCLYKRSVLDEVGSFNPFLYSDEEPDLSFRIRFSGRRVVTTKYPMTYDYAPELDLISTKIKRWKRNLYLGNGQNLRSRVGTPQFWTYVLERGYGVVPILGLLLGLIAFFVGLIGGEFKWFGGWALALVLFVGTYMIHKRSIHQTMVALVHRLIYADGTIRGFLMKPMDASDYESKHTVIQ